MFVIGLNDPGTTVPVLDVDAGLDIRAAQNLVAPRGRGFVRSVAEIDAVSQVGDATLGLLVAFALAEGWIDDADPLYGVVEGIELTQDQAAAALRIANTGSLELLDLDVGLDARAARTSSFPAGSSATSSSARSSSTSTPTTFRCIGRRSNSLGRA